MFWQLALGVGLPFLSQGLNALFGGGRSVRMPRFSSPFYDQALQMNRQLSDPTYGLSTFRSLIRVPTVADFGAMMAMQGGSPLLASHLRTQALREANTQALMQWRQFRLSTDQLRASLLSAGMQTDAERMGLAMQDLWQRRQARMSFLNNLLGMGTTIASAYLMRPGTSPFNWLFPGSMWGGGAVPSAGGIVDSPVPMTPSPLYGSYPQYLG